MLSVDIKKKFNLFYPIICVKNRSETMVACRLVLGGFAGVSHIFYVKGTV
jgi:hypothetical protein